MTRSSGRTLPIQLFEERLRAVLPGEDEDPQVLHRAMRYTVLSGGKRVRPRLLLAVAEACCAGPMCAATQQLALAAACSVELIHCASLVHDDLPSFDNASTRRGSPTVHVAFGEPLAILVGDALLTRAFELLAETPGRLASRAMRIIKLLARLTGSAEGIIGGQSLEEAGLELGFAAPDRDGAGGVTRYHTMKTAALFRFATEAGAIAAGAGQLPQWAELGVGLGLAYQLADDLYDAGGDPCGGKPVGRDAALGRPNAAALRGIAESRALLRHLLLRTRQQAQNLAARPSVLTALMAEFEGSLIPRTSAQAEEGAADHPPPSRPAMEAAASGGVAEPARRAVSG
jgi:geranylgeranyl diphosphate synthase type II